MTGPQNKTVAIFYFNFVMVVRLCPSADSLNKGFIHTHLTPFSLPKLYLIYFYVNTCLTPDRKRKLAEQNSSDENIQLSGSFIFARQRKNGTHCTN